MQRIKNPRLVLWKKYSANNWKPEKPKPFESL